MAIKPALQAKLGTALALTPQLQQAIRLLQLSQPELLLALREATESNPLLEFDEPDAHAGEAAESAEPARDDAAPGDADDDAEHATDAGPEHDEFPADDLPRSAGTHDSPLDDISPAEGLKAHLLWQLRMALRTPRDLRIAEVLVDALDEDGYLREPLDALAASLPGLDADDFSAVLHLLQQCDPVGCGARDLGECLRLQLATLDPAPPGLALARRLVDGHLDALARQSPERLAAALQVEPAELASASALLRRLDPRPGARHAEARPEYVQPDAVAARVGGRWTVRMSRTPGLALNRHYEALIGHCRREDDAYLRGHLQEARWLIRALAHRGETLQRVAQAIVEAQSGFGVMAIWASHLHHALGLSLTFAGAIVALFGLGGMLYMAVARFLIRRLGERGLVRFGVGLLGAAALVVGLSPHWAPVVPASLLGGFGFFMFHNTMQANATQMAPAARGTAVSLFAASLFLGQSIGVLLAAALVGRIGSTAVILLGGGVLVAVGGYFAAALRRRAALLGEDKDGV